MGAADAGRWLLGGYFLVAGIVNLVTPGSIRDHIDRMRGFGTPLPAAAFWCGIVLQFAGAALVLSGARIDVGALCLIAFTMLATAIFHRFWQRTDPMQKRITRLFFMSNAAIIGGLLLLFSTGARAQDFPTRPVKIIVPYAVGNGADIFARVLGDELSKKWGQQVIIDNKLGSGGVLAALELKRGRGDGHEYMLGDVGILAINPAVFRKLAYDAEKDFVPVTDILHVPWVFFTAKSGPFKTLGELIAAAKANPGKYTFSSNGVGTPTFLAAELLKLRTGIDLLHVPFRDGNQMRAAAANGDITLLTTVFVSARPVIDRLTPLAVTAPQRQAAYPDVPTVAESGGPANFNLTAWSTLMARPDTPPAVLQKVYADVTALLKQPEIRKRAADLGFDVGGRTPEQVRDFIRAETRTYREIVEVTKSQRDE